MKTAIIIEQIDLQEAVINEDDRTVRQVIIRAGKSKNGRVYGDKVLAKAATLFEGVQTYANHPSRSERRERPERSVNQLTGWLSDVQFSEGKLVGTRHFTRNQAGNDTWALVKDIVEGKAPSTLLGASINASGKVQRNGDEYIVESIEGVVSVDDVTMPAAGGGFVESISGDELLEQILADMSYEEWFESRPDFRKRLQNELKAVRQDEAVKAVEAEADRLRESFETAQTELSSLKEAHEAARANLLRARRELAIVETLQRVKLPAQWKTDLRSRLVEADEESWATIIEAEVRKAKAAGAQTRVPVAGASQQVNVPSSAHIQESVMPRPDEDVEAWRKRISK